MDLEANLEVVPGSIYKQTNAPLNLGRLDNHRNKRDRVYRYVATGKGVNAYILDKASDAQWQFIEVCLQAINVDHEEFLYRDGSKGSRASAGTSLFGKGACIDAGGLI